jgi:hypothetical protein
MISTFPNTEESLPRGYAPIRKGPREPQQRDNEITSSQLLANPLFPPVSSSHIHNRPTDAVSQATTDQEPSPRGFGEINYRTNGKEFYGPAATLAFLLELRFRAKAFQSQHGLSGHSPINARIGEGHRKTSIVTFLDADDDVPSGMSVSLRLTLCQGLDRYLGLHGSSRRHRRTSAARDFAGFPPRECASSCNNAVNHSLRKF